MASTRPGLSSTARCWPIWPSRMPPVLRRCAIRLPRSCARPSRQADIGRTGGGRAALVNGRLKGASGPRTGGKAGCLDGRMGPGLAGRDNERMAQDLDIAALERSLLAEIGAAGDLKALEEARIAA